MTEELEVLTIVTGRLESAGIPYMLTGSIATNYYSVPRMTRDIDFVVELSAADVDRFCALFEGEFYLDRNAVAAAIAERSVFNLIHQAYVVKVDCIVRKESDYRRAEFARRLRRSIEGHGLAIVAPEDLIISKLDWMRETRSEVQLVDVRNLLRSVPDLDRPYLTHWTERLGLGACIGRPSVTDTPPEVMQRYRAMLLARSPEERLKMGCSMSATARALVRASVLAQDPQASPAALRRALFLRFYGHEFVAAQRERILAWLGRDEPPAVGSPRQIPVNWNDLEIALTANSGEWACYLDLRTGDVQMIPVGRFGDDDDGPSEDEIDAGVDTGQLIHVEPLESSVEYGWMAEFAVTVGDARLRDKLGIALDGRGAFRRFKNVLVNHPAERARWFAFRDERLRAAAREWLAERDIEPTDASAASR